jgi:hypothetical protein
MPHRRREHRRFGPAPTVVQPEEDSREESRGGGQTLATWTGPAPFVYDDEAAFEPTRRHPWIVWTAVGLAASIVIAIVTALWFDRSDSTQVNQQLIAQSEAATQSNIAKAVVKRAIIPGAGPAAAPPSLSPLDTQPKIEGLMSRLFGSTDIEARLQTIAQSERHRSSVQSFFKEHPALAYDGVQALPTNIRTLPGGHYMTLCEIKVKGNNKATAITRLLPEGGDFKIDWLMMADSLGGRLATYGKAPDSQPQWITLGVRRNFGFDEPEKVRADNFVFDIQGTGNGADRTLALLPKNSPTGRVLDREISWNELYIVRVLLNWTSIEGQQRLCILDAETVQTNSL